MSKFVSRAAYYGAVSYSGATALTQRGQLWDALKTSMGLTDVNRVTITADTALTVAECGVVLVDATAGDIVLTAPASGAVTDEALYEIYRLDATANSVTFAAVGADTVEGAADVSVLATMKIRLPAGAAIWRVHSISGATPAKAKAALGMADAFQSVDYSYSAGALTLKLNPTTLAFRSTTLDAGAPTLVSNAAQIATTISSGSTAGGSSGKQTDIIILAINNAGTMELAWTNAVGAPKFDEMGVITTVAEGGAGGADSKGVIYSTTARAGVAYRVVGLFRSTQTIAGTWAQTPTLVQGIGGRALLGLTGGKWRVVTRIGGVTYYNDRGYDVPLISANSGIPANQQAVVTVTFSDGVAVTIYGADYSGTLGNAAGGIDIPAGESYTLNYNGLGGTITVWERY